MTVTHVQHHVHQAPLDESSYPYPYSATMASSGSSSSPSPDPISSTGVGVPNPFAMPSAPPPSLPGVIPGSMTVVNWGQPQQHQYQPLAAPPQTQSAPMAVAAAFSAAGPATYSSAGISQASSAMADPARSRYHNHAPAPARSSPPETGKAGGGPLNHRRQKRLERNRESARLSRRRRKQYLEVLEDRVTLLSVEMDKGRRQHVINAVGDLKAKRLAVLTSEPPTSMTLPTVANNLSRASTELRVAATFQMQQQFSLSLPSHSKFLLWLTLQNDAYFRGGRASSERLSAARIGERMLNNGNDMVPPSHGMWPLLCNEVGLSYDQEEKVRLFQRTMLKTPDSWLHRHTAAASSLLMRNTNDNFQTLSLNVDHRERGILSVLNEDQRLKYLAWAAKNADRIAKKAAQQMKMPKQNVDNFIISKDQHDAANLYILAHRLQHALNILPRPTSLVADSQMKRLSRRPSFESLGSAGLEGKIKDEEDEMTRERSFSSSGSLKRSLSDMSCEGHGEERIQGIASDEAQAAAYPTIDAALGFIKHIIPPPRTCAAASNESYAMPPPPAKEPIMWAPTPVPVMSSAPTQVAAAPVFTTMAGPPMQLSQSLPIIPSFLPAHLNIVPEERFLPENGADDFLFALAEEDWAIGEGFDMDG